ncbi:MAG: hypothetical protein AABX54_04750 [Nanoarchaeota archaeon]
MPGSFRAISQPPQSRLEALLRIAAVGIMILVYGDGSNPNGYINSYFNYEAQLEKRCHEKIEQNQIDDEVRAYLGRGQNKFFGLAPVYKKLEK